MSWYSETQNWNSWANRLWWPHISANTRENYCTLLKTQALCNSTGTSCVPIPHLHTKCSMNNQTIFISSCGRCQMINVSASAWLYNLESWKTALINKDVVIIQYSGMTRSSTVNAVIKFMKSKALLSNPVVASDWTQTTGQGVLCSLQYRMLNSSQRL